MNVVASYRRKMVSSSIEGNSSGWQWLFRRVMQWKYEKYKTNISVVNNMVTNWSKMDCSFMKGNSSGFGSLSEWKGLLRQIFEKQQQYDLVKYWVGIFAALHN